MAHALACVIPLTETAAAAGSGSRVVVNDTHMRASRVCDVCAELNARSTYSRMGANGERARAHTLDTVCALVSPGTTLLPRETCCVPCVCASSVV